MIMHSYREIADQTIKNFLKSVVLIDDRWEEAQISTSIEISGHATIDIAPPTFHPQEDVDETDLGNTQKALPGSTSNIDVTYLRDIGTEIIKEGYLFTGFQYKDDVQDTAVELASKSDILILDWNLGSGDSRPALEIIKELKKSGAPRFIFILTDQDLEEVRNNIIDQFGDPTEDNRLTFQCGTFFFSLKNKPQVDGPNIVLACELLDEVVTSVRAHFGGLLQLAALELLGQYRDCLHEVLEHFLNNTDIPFIFEWLEDDSPIRDSHSINALTLDEWTACVVRRYPSSTAQIINDDTISALLTDKKDSSPLPENSTKQFKKSIPSCITFPNDENKVTELLDSLKEWMAESKSRWPETLGGATRGKQWGKETCRDFAMHYLSVREGEDSPLEKLIDLDVLFLCQANLPNMLEQGTVLLAPNGNYLICITPSCDCSRPNRIGNCFMFLNAEKIDVSALADHPEEAVIAIRDVDENCLLSAKLKPIFTYKIENPLLQNELTASFTLETNETFTIKPIAQLRPSRVQSLISLAAGKAIAVGIDRSEIIRKSCRSIN